MKALITILFTSITLSILGQVPIDETSGKVIYTKVVSVDGKSKKYLYDRSKLWLVSTLKSGDNMVELSGDNQNSLIGTGNLVVQGISLKKDVWPDNNLNFKFIIYCKEGRVKYSVENIVFVYGSREGMITTKIDYLTGPTYWNEKAMEEWQKNLPKIDNTIKDLISNYENYITSDGEDW